MLSLRCYMRKIITSFFILSFFLAEPALANFSPNDLYYKNQWYLSKIKADSAWDKIAASPDVVVAVIDSGVQIVHPDLKDNIWHNRKEIAANGIDDDHNGFIDDTNGWDFVSNQPDPSPKFASGWTESGVSHGTMVSGIIAAQGNNREGTAGVTWRAQIMPLKVLNDQGDGKVSDVIRAVDYAINNGADIINLSFASLNYSEGLQEAIRRAHEAGVIIVAAAGNEQSGGEGYDIDKKPVYPACYDGNFGENMVIGVAATDALDQKARFSSYGSRCVDLAAPGISFFSTVPAGIDPANPNKNYDGYWSGTSMAAPLVAGALALIEQANPELTQQEVVNILFASTDNISRLNPDYQGELGNGRLNINRAVELAKEELFRRMGRLLVFPVTGNRTPQIAAANGELVSNLVLNDKTRAVGSLAAGDVDGDNQEEIIIGAPSGQAPQVKIYDFNGKLAKQFLAFDKGFRGGVNLAVHDVDNDDRAEILVVPASSGLAQVKVFDGNGKLERQFMADSKSWRGGLNISAGNIDGRGGAEIVIGYGPGAAPQVKIFTLAGKTLSSFFPYERKFRGGVKVVVANVDGRAGHNQAEIIVAPGKGREPLVKILDHHAQLKKQFLAYKKNWQNGFSLAAADLNNDGMAEIALGANPGAAPHVRVFDGQANLLESFYAWEEGFNGGANVGIIKVNN